MTLNLAACSSSGSAKAGTAGSVGASTSTGATTAPSAAAPSVAASPAAQGSSAAAAASAVPSGQGEPLAPIGCGAITPAMVNDLVTTPVTSITYSSGFGVYPDHHFECDAGMRVAVFPQDSNKGQYTSDLAAENTAAFPISGVGDVAAYAIAGLGGMPDIYAHKGAVTCELQPSSTVTDYKIAFDPNAFVPMVTKAAAAAWVAKAAVLCTAIFTALKA